MIRLLLAAWLAAWWWSLGVVLGCYANAWTSRLSGGAWAEPLQSSALLLRRAVPWLLLALVPIALGHAWLYPWADPSGAWLQGYSRPGFVRTWLSTPFWLARLVVYAIAWWWITRPASLASKGRAAASLLVYLLLTSLAGVDLLMSLVPRWFSTAFGLVVLSVQMMSGAALTAWLPPAAGTRGEGKVPISRDLGNLMLTWVMGWSYLAFMEFLIIWAENLPPEVRFYVPRLQTGWLQVSAALVLLQLAVPFLLLLFRSIKDHPQRLRWIAALLLASTALDATWMVLPSVDPHTLHGWWLAPLMFGIAVSLFAVLVRRRVEEFRHAG